jgi:hypothetical protein
MERDMNLQEIPNLIPIFKKKNIKEKKKVIMIKSENET